MTDRIEAQVERFAPGFRDLILARSTRSPADIEAHDPNYVGGDINAGIADIRQLLFRPTLVAATRTTQARACTCARPRRRPAAACTAWAVTSPRGRRYGAICASRRPRRRPRRAATSPTTERAGRRDDDPDEQHEPSTIMTATRRSSRPSSTTPLRRSLRDQPELLAERARARRRWRGAAVRLPSRSPAISSSRVSSPSRFVAIRRTPRPPRTSGWRPRISTCVHLLLGGAEVVLGRSPMSAVWRTTGGVRSSVTAKDVADRRRVAQRRPPSGRGSRRRVAICCLDPTADRGQPPAGPDQGDRRDEREDRCR